MYTVVLIVVTKSFLGGETINVKYGRKKRLYMLLPIKTSTQVCLRVPINEYSNDIFLSDNVDQDKPFGFE